MILGYLSALLPVHPGLDRELRGSVERGDTGDGDVRVAAPEVEGGAELALHPVGPADLPVVAVTRAVTGHIAAALIETPVAQQRLVRTAPSQQRWPVP